MTPILIIKTRFGGYIVKAHDVSAYETQLLFAGDAQECVHFIARYLVGTVTLEENTND